MEPFKHWINSKVIEKMADHIIDHYPDFPKQDFINLASDNLDKLELKQRTAQVTQALRVCLPKDFIHAGQIIVSALGQPLDERISGDSQDTSGISGWTTMALADFAGLYGQENMIFALEVLQEITRRGSAEFAIRYFLRDHPEKTLIHLADWIDHPDHHVRRLVSEGTRPMLPWGFQLPVFKENPVPVIQLLEQLVDDPSEYVRRSVANNLNDISKNNPDKVIEFCQKWYDPSNIRRSRLLRHACRTLLKKDHPDALKLFGYTAPQLASVQFELSKQTIVLGEDLLLNLQVQSTSSKGKTQVIMVDYIVFHQKANGTLSPKVFKWSKINLKPHESKTLHKRHAFKPVTTRQYYPGQHQIHVKMNGKVVARQDFILK